MTLTKKALNKCIKDYGCDGKEKVRREIYALAQNGRDTDYVSMVRQLKNIKGFFLGDELNTLLAVAKMQDPFVIMREYEQVSELIPDEDIREQSIDLHSKFPWEFYINSGAVKHLFNSEFFGSDERFYELFPIFLNYHAGGMVRSFSKSLQDKLVPMLNNIEVPVSIADRREQGFACGGMEKNYYDALLKGEGLTLVNDFFLAKMYHRKGNPKKVSLIAKGNATSSNGYPVWEDVIYAPSCCCHEKICDAISQNKSAVDMNELTIRPVRPLIEMKSSKMVDTYILNKKDTT
ncbi:MAG: hypothetical protein ACMXYK_03585 [Candidatus Woesearchaeota archaeon]